MTHDGTRLFLSSEFPANREQTQKLWQLWKLHKDAIKEDGFSATKDKYTGQYKIMYWHDIEANDHVKDAAGVPRWRAQMLDKLNRWAEELEQVVLEDMGRRGRKEPINVGDVAAPRVVPAAAKPKAYVRTPPAKPVAMDLDQLRALAMAEDDEY